MTEGLRRSVSFANCEQVFFERHHAVRIRYVYRIINDIFTAHTFFITRLDYRTMDKTMIDRISSKLSETGLSARSASLRAGLSESFIRNILTGKSKSPRGDTLSRLADVLGTSEMWLLKGEGDDGQIAPSGTSPARATAFQPQLIPGSELVSSNRDLPIYAAAKGGDGHVIVTFEPIDYMKRPAVLENVKGGYGLLITGDSMVPAYRPGETALINPNLPPARDTDVVLYHTNGTNESEAIIKRLVGINDREWSLEQYNPMLQFTEFRAEWPICHRVVGKYNTR